MMCDPETRLSVTNAVLRCSAASSTIPCQSLLIVPSSRNLDLEVARLDEPVVCRLPLLISRLQVVSQCEVKVADKRGD